MELLFVFVAVFSILINYRCAVDFEKDGCRFRAMIYFAAVAFLAAILLLFLEK